MQKLFFNLVLFTLAVIGWVVYSHWPQIEAFGNRVLAIGEDLGQMAKRSGMLPPATIEAGEPQTGAPSPASGEGDAGSAGATIYKWQDPTGRWHFGDDPPPDARHLTEMNVAANINVMRAVEVPEPEPETRRGPAAGMLGAGRSGPFNQTESSEAGNTTIPGIPNPANVQDLINQIGQIQNQQRDTGID